MVSWDCENCSNEIELANMDDVTSLIELLEEKNYVIYSLETSRYNEWLITISVKK